MQHGIDLPENLADGKPLVARISIAPEKLASGSIWGMAKKPPSDLQKAVTARLRAVQAELGKSDSQMARMVGVGRSRWSQWVGTSNMPAEEAMLTLCDKAGITLDWLYRGKVDLIPTRLAIRLELRAANIDPDLATEKERAAIVERVTA